MSAELWLMVGSFVLSAIGFAVHTTWKLGQIAGTLERDLTHLGQVGDDHEKRIRRIEHRHGAS